MSIKQNIQTGILATLLLGSTAYGQFNLRTAQSEGLSADSLLTVRNVSKDPLHWYTPIANIPRHWGRWWGLTMRSDMIDEWLIVSGLSAGLVVTDDLTYTPSDRFYRSSPAATRWSDFFAGFGDGRTQFMLAAAFGAYGLLGEDDRALRTGAQIFEVVLAAGAIVQVFKHVTGRESPFVRSTPTGVWRMFPSQIDYHRKVPYHDAFPSGHLCTSIATVVVIAENYPEDTWIRPVGFGLSALVAIGMANNGIHWYSDYPLGIFIGYTVGMLAAHPEGIEHELTSLGARQKLSLRPMLYPDGGGLSLVVRFD